MPMPAEYWNASKEFEAFMQDVRDTCMLQTHHQAYHTLRAVLHVFRSHLSVNQALAFAGVLPPVVRAIFVEGWQPDVNASPSGFPDRSVLQTEVKSIRRDHNLAPDSAIADVAAALRRSSIDKHDLDNVLNRLPDGAVEFWRTGQNID